MKSTKKAQLSERVSQGKGDYIAWWMLIWNMIRSFKILFKAHT
jgi:hypothetical protein